MKYNKICYFCIVTLLDDIILSVSLNRGVDTEGQTIKGRDTHVEPTFFDESHFVGCYLIKNGVCVVKIELKFLWMEDN